MTYNISLVFRIITFFIISSVLFINCDVLVTGRCGRPGLPPNSKLKAILVSSERYRFDNNEKVSVICDKNEFPHHEQVKYCKNGQWIGKKARCGNSYLK
jgi:hypothetical protein